MKFLSDVLSNKTGRLGCANGAGVDTEVIAVGLSPVFASIVIIIGGTSALHMMDALDSFLKRHLLLFHKELGTRLDIGCDKDIDHIGEIAQHIVSTTAYKDARALLGRLNNGIALKLEEPFLLEIVLIEIAIPRVDVRQMEERTKEAFPFVALLEELF